MNNLLPLRREGFPPSLNMNTCRTWLYFGLAALVGAWPAVSLAADAAAKPVDSKAKGQADTVNPGSTYQTNNYVLRPTDVIGVRVIDDDRASSDFTISADGTVGLTYLDPDHPLKVEGLTVAEAVKLISSEYVRQKIFIKPTITVTVKTYAERRINVLGDVGAPGWVVIPPEQNLSLVSAIAQAHGPSPRAYHIVTITRKNADGSTKTYTADLRAAMKGTGPDFPLEEGDTINVTESLIGNDFQ